MIIKKFVVGDIANNNYLLIEGKEALLVDCTDTIPELDSTLKEYKAILKKVLITHGHFDHIKGVKKLQDNYKITVYMHEADKEIVENTNSFLGMVGMPSIDIPKIDVYLKDRDKIKFANKKFEVIHLPGHTPGGVGYKIDNMIFSGDTIFLGTVGRTDLPGGDFEQLKSSIKEKLFTLDENTTIYTGHGADTTVGQEKKYNSFV